jgi:hypothetical protein
MDELLTKIKRLENYVCLSTNVDPYIPTIIDKLIFREKLRLKNTIAQLEQEKNQFELQYQISSEDFYNRFMQGESGDSLDFLDWSATYEMLQNTKKALALLTE